MTGTVHTALPLVRYAHGCKVIPDTIETGYKVAICPRGKQLYLRINVIADQNVLFRGVLGLGCNNFIAELTL